MDSIGSNSFAGGANPFMNGGNPFGAGPNLFSASTNEVKPNNNFNIDDIVKKIDQKIAELEEEERKEQEEQKKKQQASIENNALVEVEKPVDKKDLVQTSNVEPVQKTGISPTPQVNSDVSDIYKKTVTDDQFFDDFFDE